MSQFRILGGKPLDGTVQVQGAKNSVLPILAASLLAGGETVIHNCPRLSDVDAAISILRHFGCTVNRIEHTLYINSGNVVCSDIPEHLMKEMRSSVFFLGAILARTGEACLSRPGGCALGPRPIDLHLAALRTMGAEVIDDGDSVCCRAKKLRGCTISLPFPSVGATENSMLAASAADGTVIIENAAREPEIRDLQEYMRKLGVRVSGAGTPRITVEGRNVNSFAQHRVIPDRIAAATWLSAAAATCGRVEVQGILPADLSAVTNVLAKMGCKLSGTANSLCADARSGVHSPGHIETGPYPGFPTDAQPPLMAAVLRAAGTTGFTENIFTDRFRQANGFRAMGADIQVVGTQARVTGVRHLTGAHLEAADLRGGASLAVAALGAENESVLTGVRYIDRGYEDFEGCLRRLGGQVTREP